MRLTPFTMSSTLRQKHETAPASAKHSMVRFAFAFVVLAVVLHAISATPWFKAHVGAPIVNLNAKIAAAALRLTGHDVVADGPSISSLQGGIVLAPSEGFHPTFLYIAAVLAFPAPIRSKFFAAILGTALLALLNLIRIICQYHARIGDSEQLPARFDVAFHWLFILAVMLMWFAWAWRIARKSRTSSHARW